jgi:hypothetical protein
VPLQAVLVSRRWDASARTPVWGKTTKDRSEVLVWLAAVAKGADHFAELADRGPAFGALGNEWLDALSAAASAVAAGAASRYSDTTIESMRRRWEWRAQQIVNRYVKLCCSPARTTPPRGCTTTCGGHKTLDRSD